MGKFLLHQAYWSSPPLANLNPLSILLMKNLDKITRLLINLNSSIKTQQEKTSTYFDEISIGYKLAIFNQEILRALSRLTIYIQVFHRKPLFLI